MATNHLRSRSRDPGNLGNNLIFPFHTKHTSHGPAAPPVMSLMMTELEHQHQHLEHNQYNVPTVHPGYYISVLPCLMKSNLITNPPTLQSTVMCHRQPYNSCRLVREPRDCDNNLALTALQPPVSSRYLLSPDLLYFKSFNSNPTSISTQPPTSFPTRLQLTFSHSSELHFTKRPFRI